MCGGPWPVHACSATGSPVHLSHDWVGMLPIQYLCVYQSDGEGGRPVKQAGYCVEKSSVVSTWQRSRTFRDQGKIMFC